MVRIGICDDQPQAIENLKKLLDEYFPSRKIEATVSRFGGADALLQTMQSGVHFDILLLDIIMPFLNGIELAREVRKLDPHCPILFISSSREYGVDAFGVKAVNYIVKPVKKEQLFETLDTIIESQQQLDNDKLVLRTGGQTLTLRHADILFAETNKHNLIIHLKNADNIVLYKSMREFEQLLEEYDRFVRCHSAYLVNMQHIVSASASEFVLFPNTIIPISRTYQTNVKQKYFEYISSAH